MAVVQVGGRDGGEQQATICVGERMRLAPDHAPGWIVAAFASNAHAARACRLGIHDGPARVDLAPGSFAVRHRQGMGKAFEHLCLR